ncbi:hypothetical protein [Borrelia sp. RT1S]|uniref:hypothetical protein n=1 Tax=Borrelia sp. RT1S TaxID=2898580 RepID=UPI001E49BBC8|nr:hypothetical protein [Borrelia sp. RT1S]UGQ17919.1 hypothetical protein LSO05_05665 [Borrelia sp. RT1S]
MKGHELVIYKDYIEPDVVRKNIFEELSRRGINLYAAMEIALAPTGSDFEKISDKLLLIGSRVVGVEDKCSWLIPNMKDVIKTAYINKNDIEALCKDLDSLESKFDHVASAFNTKVDDMYQELKADINKTNAKYEALAVRLDETVKTHNTINKVFITILALLVIPLISSSIADAYNKITKPQTTQSKLPITNVD